MRVHDETSPVTLIVIASITSRSYRWCDTQFILCASAGRCDSKNDELQDEWVYTRVPAPTLSHSALLNREQLKLTNARLIKLMLVGMGHDDWYWSVLCVCVCVCVCYLVLVYEWVVHNCVDVYVYIITYVRTRICPLAVSATSHSRRARLHGCGYLWWTQTSDNSLDPTVYTCHTLTDPKHNSSVQCHQSSQSSRFAMTCARAEM